MAALMSKVSFASKVPTLMKATSDDPKPTPGYLYIELCKITFESLDYCEYMVDFLVERLKKKSLHVKLKVLLVMRNAVEKGHEEFSKYLRKKSDGIQECKGISGPLDPLHGDKYYVDTRNAANDVLDRLYNVNQNILAGTQGRTNNVLSSTAKMEGFGNTSSEATPGFFQSVVGKIKENVPNFLPSTSSSLTRTQSPTYQKYDDPSNVINRPSDTLWGFGSGGSGPTTQLKANLSSQSSAQYEGLSSGLSSNKTVNWVVKKDHFNENSFNAESRKKYEVDFHETEKKIVDEITTPQGIRQQPLKQELDQFCKKCATLDRKFIIDLLNEKLEEQDSRVQMRSMYVLEALLQTTLIDIKDIIRNHCQESLQKFLSSSHSTTRNKAQKILQSLNANQFQLESSTVTQYIVPPLQTTSSSLNDPGNNQSEMLNLSFASNNTPNTSIDDIMVFPDTPKSPYSSQIKKNDNQSHSTPPQGLLNFDPFESLSSGSNNNNVQIIESNNSASNNPTAAGFHGYSQLQSNPIELRQSGNIQDHLASNLKNTGNVDHINFPEKSLNNRTNVLGSFTNQVSTQQSTSNTVDKTTHKVNNDFFSNFDKMNISQKTNLVAMHNMPSTNLPEKIVLQNAPFSPKANTESSEDFNLFEGMHMTSPALQTSSHIVNPPVQTNSQDIFNISTAQTSLGPLNQQGLQARFADFQSNQVKSDTQIPVVSSNIANEMNIPISTNKLSPQKPNFNLNESLDPFHGIANTMDSSCLNFMPISGSAAQPNPNTVRMQPTTNNILYGSNKSMTKHNQFLPNQFTTNITTMQWNGTVSQTPNSQFNMNTRAAMNSSFNPSQNYNQNYSSSLYQQRPVNPQFYPQHQYSTGQMQMMPPQGNSFGFINNSAVTTTKSQSRSSDSFSFVQDAMKASRKK